jgi:O-antigen ligase
MAAAMVKKRRGRSSDVKPRVRTAARAPSDLGAWIAASALALAIFGVGLVVDTGADASFDAPKRLLTLVLVAAAGASLAFGQIRNPLRAERGRLPRLTLVLAAAALGLAVVSALFSPRRAPALDATRSVLLYALLLPIGASRVLDKGKALLLATFLTVAGVNAAVSILQARGVYQPFALKGAGSRESTGAFVGNVGYLALTLALAAVAALALLLTSRRIVIRAAAGLCLALFLAALLFNRNLTSLSALFAGTTLLLFALLGRRALPYVAAALALLVLAIGLYRPMRVRVRQVWHFASTGNWRAATTYRVGAWTAAVSMAADRPVLGYGPGTFGAEFVSHRLAAEISHRRRYVNPLRTSSYGEAHCDYLQPFAEIGIPAGLATLGALLLLSAGLVPQVRSLDVGQRREAGFLMAFLGAGAAAALTWFPMQRAVTAIPLLLAAGRAWRTSAGQTPPPAEPPRRLSALRLAQGLVAVALLASAVWPEFPRYAAERALRQASGSLRFVFRHSSEVPDPQQTLSNIATLAAGAAPALPGDTRPWILAGGAYLVKREPDRALDFYRKALADGERAETDLNIGRAYEGLGQMEKAHQAFLRTVWVSPILRRSLPRDIARPLQDEVKRLKQELKAGRLKSPPPLPN